MISGVEEIVEEVKKILPRQRPLDHHRPYISWSPWLSILGYEYVNEFEDKLREITKAQHVIATNCGTAALHIALKVAGVRPGDEVIVPSLTFVATANAVSHCGAIPHFFDCGLSLDAAKLRSYLDRYTKPSGVRRGRINTSSGNPITAVIPVHLLGFPTSLSDLSDCAADYGLLVVEDSAEALGSYNSGQHVGTHGRAGILSFNNNKIITTNGGGAILTNDADLADRAQHLVTTARLPHPWRIDHDEVAWNYRMGNINAGLGLVQLEMLDEILDAKHRLAGCYRRCCSNLRGVDSLGPCDYGGTKSNHWLNTFVVDRAIRENLLRALHSEGIYARALFTPLHMSPMYKNNPRSSIDMPEAVGLYETSVCLPSGPGLAPAKYNWA
jgi:perosamine synthetase